MSNRILDNMPIQFNGALFTPITGEPGIYVDQYGIRYTIAQVEEHRRQANTLMSRVMRHERNQPWQTPRV